MKCCQINVNCTWT